MSQKTKSKVFLNIEKIYITMYMSFLDDTYCQLCERSITKEDWNNHLYTKKNLHRGAVGYWPAFFPQ